MSERRLNHISMLLYAMCSIKRQTRLFYLLIMTKIFNSNCDIVTKYSLHSKCIVHRMIWLHGCSTQTVF